MLKKLDWILTGASNIDVVSGVLEVTKDGTDFEVELDAGKIKLDGEDLTTENVTVEDIDFDEKTPPGISVELTIDGITTTYTKYLRI